MSYKLSHTAQEVDELLGKVKGGVCLPVVEITSAEYPTGTNPVELSAEEAAAFTAAAESNMPVLAKFKYQGMDAAVVALYMGGNGVAIYGATQAGLTFAFANFGDGWAMGGEE